MVNKKSKIFIAGHNGMVGSAVLRKLKNKGFSKIILSEKKNLDLLNQNKVFKFLKKKKPDLVIIAAARVGGILANATLKHKFIYENLQIQNNLIHGSYLAKIKNLIFLGSSCIYPKFCKQPMKESYLLSGKLEETNDAYGIAKIAGIMMCHNYSKNYKLNYQSLMPPNLYGPGDNFHPENGHVIPALMHKFNNSTDKTVTCWGDGTPMREFTYVDDLADACLFAMDHYENAELINVGSGQDISIFHLAHKIAKLTGYTGNIEWDTNRPNGTPKRPLDYSKISSLGWKPKYTLTEGLQKTYEWFCEHTYLQTK